MSSFYLFIVMFLYTSCDTQPLNPIKRECTRENIGCKPKTFDFKAIVAGNRSLDVETSDPLIADTIQGNFPDIKYLFYNPKMHGFKDCSVQDFSLRFEKRSLYFELFCPRLNLYGFYRTKGDALSSVHIEGEGSANVVIYDYLIKIYALFSMNKEPDSKNYIHLDKFYGQYVPQGPVLLHFDNLYNGRRDLSDAAYRMLNKNAKELMLAYGHPILDAFMEKFINNTNKYLTSTAIEDILFDYS